MPHHFFGSKKKLLMVEKYWKKDFWQTLFITHTNYVLYIHYRNINDLSFAKQKTATEKRLPYSLQCIDTWWSLHHVQKNWTAQQSYLGLSRPENMLCLVQSCSTTAVRVVTSPPVLLDLRGHHKCGGARKATTRVDRAVCAPPHVSTLRVEDMCWVPRTT